LLSTPVFAAETSTNDIDRIEEESPYQYKVIAQSGLNVRSYASTSAPIIAILPYGTIVDASFMQPGGTPAGWLYISSPIKGYVASQYLGDFE
jgi:hypothetical protein